MKNENVGKRLKIIEGHIRGIERMIDEDAYCIDVIRQIQAVQSALNKISGIVLEGHLNTCVVEALRNDNTAEQERVLKEITEVFNSSTRV